MGDRQGTEAIDLVDDVIAAAHRDLAAAIDEVERLRRDHRRVETVLQAILDKVQVPIAVVDRDLHVCALSAEGERRWQDRIGRRVTHDEAAIRAVLDGPDPTASDGGLQVARVEEPGTGDRFVVAWRSD